MLFSFFSIKFVQCSSITCIDTVPQHLHTVTTCMSSLSYSTLEIGLRVHLLSCLTLLDEATKRATTVNVSLFFPIENTPLCSFCVSALSLKPPVGYGRWPLTLSMVLLEVSSC
ncbi:hypothetical protein AMECASPLE_007219 [Ameca splendens]|uniref:Secreted protein n=1 Tax=Ameca splendens TaxID=208324 RepID=A0ABV0XCQ8_9TELE